MSENNIPFEIQMEIVQRIPDTKSVILCRSVSKAWKSTIDSKKFVAAHTLRNQNRHHLLIRTQDCIGDIPNSVRCDYTPVKYYSIVDDDTFPLQKVSLFAPNSVHKFRDDSVIVGTSRGLFYFYDELGEDTHTGTAVIWNPFIRKTVATKVPKVRQWYYWTVVGFGVCPRNLDPKLVKISYVRNFRRLQDVNASTQVEVFTLSSGRTWRSPLSGNLPHKSITFESHTVVDGFIYWSAFDNVGEGYRNPKLIMSFDLTTEEFTKVNLPDSLALDCSARLLLCNLRESLAVLKKFNKFNGREICHVWQMIGHGCTRSFNKLYTFGASIHKTLGFRKSGAPIIEVDNDKQGHYKYEHALAMYEPESKSITNIGIYGLHHTFFVRSYMETLLLLDYEI